MSYQVIARKWRPQIFEEVIGQDSVTQTLRNAIEHDRLHHAYIFSGARGVGKTTTARLLAKALNCHKTDQANPKPCDTSSSESCPSCKEISESRSLDVLEFDAASNTQVDKIREIIIENIQISAARDRFKVFIIDEVHMLSKSSFNALLKTLEEPPKNVVFVMATTELHKVPDTILSRVQEFEFRTIPLQKIFNRLKTIAEAENIKISENALKEIARSGEGSMRDAQSNFDQVISFSGEQIDVEDVTKALGIASAENLTTTIQAISDKNPQKILIVIDDLIARGQDLRHFCTDLLALIRDLLVFKMAGDAPDLLDTAILSFEDLKIYSEPFTESDLIRFFNSLAETESSLREANEPRFMLEIGLLKLIEMSRVMPIEQLLERLVKLESHLNSSDLDPENSIRLSESKRDSNPGAEKKTLNPDFPLDEVPFPITNAQTKPQSIKIKEVSPLQNQDDILTQPEKPELNMYSEPESETFEEEPPQSIDDSQHHPTINLDTLPVKLEPIASEELEHIEDKWLDNVYDYKLWHEGDDLKVIPGASKLISDFLNLRESTIVPVKDENSPRSNGISQSGKAQNGNKALDIVSEMTIHKKIDETIPLLPENPTEEELLNYAQNHPSVKKVINIFRGKLVKVIPRKE